MPVLINITTAEHGGTKPSCGSGDHSSCGPNCDCGCPYTGMAERGQVRPIGEAERAHPDEWLAFVIPPGEDEFAPEQGVLVAHSPDDAEVWDAVSRITFNQVVHVYFNGPLDRYMAWADAE